MLAAELRRVQLRAVGFAYQVEDPVANVTLTSTPALITRQRQNLGETSSRGMELSASSVLFSHLRWQLGYQYTRAIVQDFPADVTLVFWNQSITCIPSAKYHCFQQVKYKVYL
jgi:hypothetical protein